VPARFGPGFRWGLAWGGGHPDGGLTGPSPAHRRPPHRGAGLKDHLRRGGVRPKFLGLYQETGDWTKRVSGSVKGGGNLGASVLFFDNCIGMEGIRWRRPLVICDFWVVDSGLCLWMVLVWGLP